ncbi:hypothetical protein QOT17_25645 [Balamuthia mandrillaris]
MLAPQLAHNERGGLGMARLLVGPHIRHGIAIDRPVLQPVLLLELLQKLSLEDADRLVERHGGGEGVRQQDEARREAVLYQPVPGHVVLRPGPPAEVDGEVALDAPGPHHGHGPVPQAGVVLLAQPAERHLGDHLLVAGGQRGVDIEHDGPGAGLDDPEGTGRHRAVSLFGVVGIIRLA